MLHFDVETASILVQFDLVGRNQQCIQLLLRYHDGPFFPDALEDKGGGTLVIRIVLGHGDLDSGLYYYPGMKPDVLDALVDNGYQGIIWDGTGLGHVNRGMFDAIQRATDKGVHQYMCVQTIWGYAHMFVYDTGRDLMNRGIIPAGNMLAETAYIKLGWALGQTHDREEVKNIMLTPVNSEITPREPYNGYLVYQGGVPEVEDFIRRVHK